MTDVNLWSIVFNRWYIGVFLVVWGGYLIARAGWLNDIRRSFPKNVSDKLAVVLERRRHMEARPLTPWYFTGGFSVVSGIAALLGYGSGSVWYASTCVLFAVGLTASYLRMQNSGPRRAATLTPRRVGSVIAWPWYPIGALAALAPLVFVDVPGQRAAAVGVALSAFAVMKLAIRANEMPALLTGDDAELEMHVDETLRRLRVKALWAIGIGVAYVYVVFTFVSAEPTLLHEMAFGFLIVVFAALYWPVLAASMRRLARQ